MHISWARLASFCHLGFINDPLIVSKFHNETHDPKGQENKIYTIVKGRETFYRRHTVPVTSCSKVKYVLKRVSLGSKVIRLQRSGIDTIKYHTWPRIPMGKWQTHRRHYKREPRGQPFPSRWPQSTYKQTRTKHSKHKTEQKHKRSTKEVPPWNGQ